VISINPLIFLQGHINLGKKGYSVPRSGTIQVTLFNPLGTVVKMFVVAYDLSDMPPCSQTFLRQRTLYLPSQENGNGQMQHSNLRYLIHLRYKPIHLTLGNFEVVIAISNEAKWLRINHL
jgi:hypothetical protein